MEAFLNKKQNFILILLPLGLLVTFGIWGIDFSDQGFIRGYSWRLSQGEIPYKDFIYPRPPLTIYIDYFFKFFSPLSLEVVLERLRFYIQLLLTSYLVISRIDGINKEDRFKFILISYLASIASFPPMAWHTVDGVFFGSLAFYFLRLDKFFCLAIFFSFLSALTKQSFYPLPLFVIGYGLWSRRKLWEYGIGILPLIVFIASLILTDSVQPFLLQTNGASKLSDLLNAGLFSYFNLKTLKYLIILSSLYYGLHKKNKWFWIIASGCLFFELFKFVGTVITTAEHQLFVHWPRALLVLASLYLLSIRFTKDFIPLTFLILIAWCSSISWGAKTPGLFLTGIVVVLYFIVVKYLPNYKKIIVSSGLSLTLFIFLISNINRYLEGRIWENTYHLGDLNKSYSFIMTTKETFNTYQAMAKINQLLPNVSFLPHFSDSSYFLRKRSVLPIDWVFDVEVRTNNYPFFDDLKNCKNEFAVYKAIDLTKSYKLLSWIYAIPNFEEIEMFKVYCGSSDLNKEVL